MIKWRLKSGDSEKLFTFRPRLFSETDEWMIYKEFDISSWMGAFQNVRFKNILTVGDITFIPDGELIPEVVNQVDGHYEYYLQQNGTRITEIPLQNSSQELVLEISERSKI